MPGNKAVHIAITGPESTGKSELTKKLAHHFRGTYVPEIARDYLDHLGRPYRYDDILDIAQKQQKAIRKAIRETDSGYLFFDTELLVLRIWCAFSFGRCFPWIIEQQEAQTFDLYLLTAPDLPWVPDPLREHPQQREALFDLYHQLLVQQNRPFEIIRGLEEDRINNAIDIINQRF